MNYLVVIPAKKEQGVKKKYKIIERKATNKLYN